MSNLNQNQINAKAIREYEFKKSLAKPESRVEHNALLVVLSLGLFFTVFGPATQKVATTPSLAVQASVEQVQAPVIQPAPVVEQIEAPAPIVEAPKVKSVNATAQRESKRSSKQDEVKQAVEDFKARNTVQQQSAVTEAAPAVILKPTEDLQGGGFVGSLDDLEKNLRVEPTPIDMQTKQSYEATLDACKTGDKYCGLNTNSHNAPKEAVGGSRTPDIIIVTK
jgi:hypothetical protein